MKHDENRKKSKTELMSNTCKYTYQLFQTYMYEHDPSVYNSQKISEGLNSPRVCEVVSSTVTDFTDFHVHL